MKNDLWYYNINNHIDSIFESYTYFQSLEELAQRGELHNTDALNNSILLRMAFSLGLNVRNKIGFGLNEPATNIRTIHFEDGEIAMEFVFASGQKQRIPTSQMKHTKMRHIVMQEIGDALNKYAEDFTFQELVSNDLYNLEVRPSSSIPRGMIAPVGTATSSNRMLARALAFSRLMIQLYFNKTVRERFYKQTSKIKSANDAVSNVCICQTEEVGKKYKIEYASEEDIESDASYHRKMTEDKLKERIRDILNLNSDKTSSFSKVYPDAKRF